MTENRALRLASTGARVLAGTVVSVFVVAAVVLAVVVPWPTLQREVLSVAATPAPSDTVVACDGPLLALGRDAANAGGLSVAGEQAVVSGTAADALAAGSTLSATSVPDSRGPDVFTAAPVDRQRTEVAASGSATVSADDLRGFAASACQPALMQSWLVAGATTTGSSDLVVLANPGAVSATVQLTVYGATGAVTAPGGSDIVLAPGTQRVVPLAGLVIGEESPVVQVTASGAPVQASLQSSITRTLVPGGVDQTGMIAVAATTQVIPGVTVTSAPGAVGASNATSVLRVLSAAADTTATVTLTADDGSTTTIPNVTLSAGIPSEVELGGLDQGTYTVRVDAEAAVVAAVWQATGFGADDDFAWYSAAPTLSGAALVAVPRGPGATLWVTNTGTDAASLTLSGPDGSRDIAVAPGRAVSVAVTEGAVYSLVPQGSNLHAGVSFSGAGALAGFPVWPEDAAAGTVVVHP